MDTYRSELGRLSHETASAAADAGGRSIGERLRIVPYYVTNYFGIPVIALTAFGAWQMRRLRDRLTLAVAGWALACAIFMLIGILTPMDMRYYLAAVPAVSIAASVGASRAWQRGAAWRIAAVVLLAGATITGVRFWWSTLG
jgi:hypothetical protein